VIEMVGGKSKIRYEPKPQDDPKQRRPDISKAEQVLGWRPEIRLADGLVKTVAYFDKLLHDVDVRAQVSNAVLKNSRPT